MDFIKWCVSTREGHVALAAVAVILGALLMSARSFIAQVVGLKLIVVGIGYAIYLILRMPEAYAGMPEDARIAQTADLQAKVEATADIAYAIWYEARGEGRVGQLAVATVIWNRAGGNPDGLVEVVRKSDWLGNCPRLNPLDGDWSCPVLTGDCWSIARQMVEGTFIPLGEWTHFWNPRKASPVWGPKVANRVQVGRHVFGRL